MGCGSSKHVSPLSNIRQISPLQDVSWLLGTNCDSRPVPEPPVGAFITALQNVPGFSGSISNSDELAMRADWKLFTYDFVSRLADSNKMEEGNNTEKALCSRFSSASAICTESAKNCFKKIKIEAQRLVLLAFAEILSEHFSLCAASRLVDTTNGSPSLVANAAHVDNGDMPSIIVRRSSTALWG